MSTVIAPRPPADGRDWDCMCARCGSSMTHVDCDECGGDGDNGHDCGEDSCCCLYPEENIECSNCDGAGGWLLCVSSEEFCEANPLNGREDVKRHTTEWYPA